MTDSACRFQVQAKVRRRRVPSIQKKKKKKFTIRVKCFAESFHTIADGISNEWTSYLHSNYNSSDDYYYYYMRG